MSDDDGDEKKSKNKDRVLEKARMSETSDKDPRESSTGGESDE